MSIALFWWSRRVIYFHLQVHFIIIEIIANTLIYELDVLYIFGINIVCPYGISEFIWFFDLRNFSDTQYFRILNFAYLTVDHENRYFFLSIKFNVEKK